MSIREQRNTQTLLYIILVILLLAIIAGVIVALVLFNRINSTPPTDDNAYLLKTEFAPTLDPNEVPTAAPTFTPMLTPTPFSTYTPEPTYTPQPTYTPYVTLTPQPTPTIYVTPVFMFNVDEVLYLDTSIASGDYWNPDKPLPFVPEDDRIAILALVKAAQDYRQYVWLYEDYADLADYNAGYALDQMYAYYDYYIDTEDGCYVDIEIAGDQFHTYIIAYSGTIAKTMTFKVESRNRICGGESVSWIPADGYAYEMRLERFSDGMGGYEWKIIEHPLGSDPSQ
ncbi:MAG: hypothetical protein V2J07_05870 [Anaerolineae bacterium]|jgi:hypothetical protein|nr:hypothetical protein [Anaerolineae bacterium]